MKNWKLVLNLSLFSVLIFPHSTIYAQLYWGGTSAQSWIANSGTRWGTINGGPYSTNWVSGSAAIFNVPNSTITGATTSFSSITANENVTVTATGTIGTGGNVGTITVAGSKTFDFGTQAISTAAGTGFIKEGEGILAMAGGTYSGGFTLNSGTMIVRGVNAMGAGGSNTLSINGGTLAANASRDLSGKYPGGITIGGNFIIGANTGLALSSANLTFTNNVNLGTSSTRTITLGGTGTYLFKTGVISGPSSNLIIEATQAGTLSLEGANTFSGFFSSNGGTINLNLNNALGSVTSVIVGNSAIVQTGITSLTNAINDAASITINGTGELDLSGGSETVGSLISSSPTASIVIGDYLTNSGSFTIGDGNSTSFAGIISGSRASSGAIFTKTGSGTLTLTGANTYTASSGNTTISAGTLELNRSGGNTIPASSNVVVNGGTLLISSNQTLNNLTVASGASLILQTGVTLTISGASTINGTIDCGSSGIVAGTGTFTLSTGATLKTDNANGISGSITTATKNFQNGANYEFNGATQDILSLLPTTVNNLTLSGSGIKTVSGNRTINGNFTISGATISLSAGTTYNIKGNISNSGIINSLSGTTFVFDGSNPQSITGTSVLNFGDLNISNTSGSGVTTNSIFAVLGDLRISQNSKMTLSFSDIPVDGSLYLNNVQQFAGTHGSSSSSPPAMYQNNLYFAGTKRLTVAMGAPLPVELVFFTARKEQQATALNWETASELDNEKFLVERSLDGKEFQVIGEVKGHGNTNMPQSYDFMDRVPASGVNYYRLKQMDFDGGFEYSEIVSVSFEDSKTNIQLYPTITNGAITLSFSSPTNETGSIQIFDYNGKFINLLSFEPNLEQFSLSVDSLQSGAYLMKIFTGHEVETLRFYKL